MHSQWHQRGDRLVAGRSSKGSVISVTQTVQLQGNVNENSDINPWIGYIHNIRRGVGWDDVVWSGWDVGWCGIVGVVWSGVLNYSCVFEHEMFCAWVQCGLVWCGVVWCSVVRCVVWCGVV